MREPRSHGSPVRATDLARRIDQARGLTRADLVIKGARVFNLVTGELNRSDIAVCGDTIVGTDEEGYRGVVEIDGRGLVAVPGFIDTHLHPESTLVLPGEFERLLLTLCMLPRELVNAGQLDAREIEKRLLAAPEPCAPVGRRTRRVSRRTPSPSRA